EAIFELEGVVYTDGNAASGETNFFKSTNVIGPLLIDWNIVLRNSKCYSPEYRRKKCAEVLVPDFIPSQYIIRYVVMNQNSYKLFSEGINLLIKNGWIKHKVEIKCDPTYFYSLNGEILAPNA